MDDLFEFLKYCHNKPPSRLRAGERRRLENILNGKPTTQANIRIYIDKYEKPKPKYRTGIGKYTLAGYDDSKDYGD